MAVFESEVCFISCSQSQIDRANRIMQVIIALENQSLEAAGNSDISEYSLDDGQIRIKTAYRTPEEIAKAIDHYEKIYNRIVARCSGTRIVSLRDARAFNLNSGNAF